MHSLLAQSDVGREQLGNGAAIRAELYPEVAPNTVNSFISLISKGFYDGLTFHRVIPGFMSQSRCPKGIGIGGLGYTITGEFSRNGFKNDLKHAPGVLSMARSQHPDSAGSQSLIMAGTSPHLDGSYAAFGKVVSGYEEVECIVAVERDRNDKPLAPQRIKKVTVELFGVEYPQPSTTAS